MQLLTVEQLADRWQVSTDTVLGLVRLRGVPWVSLRTSPSGRGPKTLRFRPDAIAAWELENQATWGQAERPAPQDDAARLAALGWDGVTR